MVVAEVVMAGEMPVVAVVVVYLVLLQQTNYRCHPTTTREITGRDSVESVVVKWLDSLGDQSSSHGSDRMDTVAAGGDGGDDCHLSHQTNGHCQCSLCELDYGCYSLS